MHQDATWYGGRPQPRQLCGRWGPSRPFPKRDAVPNFRCTSIVVKRLHIWIKMSLGTEVGLGLRGIVLDVDPARQPLKVHSLQLSANVRCGQTAEWTKMPLGTAVNLGPGDFVFDGDPATPRKKANGWMHQDATWYGGRPQPRQLCGRWGPSRPPQKGAEPPIFGPRLLWSKGLYNP